MSTPNRSFVARTRTGAVALLVVLATVLGTVGGVLVATGSPASAAVRAGSSDPVAHAAVEALHALYGVRLSGGDSPDPADQAVAEAAANARYATARAALAGLVAGRATADAAALSATWLRASDVRMVAVYSALSQVGVPYRRFKAAPGSGFDCSGLTSWAYGQAGVTLGRNSRSQIGASTKIPSEAVQPGDLVYNPGHIVMALGNGSAIVEAPHSGELVRVRDWKNRRLTFGDPLA